MVKTITEIEVMNIFEPQKYNQPVDCPFDYDFIEFDETDIIMERSQMIKKISDESNMIYEMFNDLNVLVYGQQENINSICDNISVSQQYIIGAEEELIEAEIIQAKISKKYIFISSILIASVSMPIGMTIGLKAGLVTA